MNEFIKLLEEAKMIEKIRNLVPEEDLEMFDQVVEIKTKEYQEMWEKIRPDLEAMKTGIEKDADKPKDK
tara:strand:- start:931 stop:1137 length:207 start_codon:yes stop_codon:yes gene_type:complete